MAEEYSIVYIDHIFIHSSFDGHRGFFHSLAMFLKELKIDLPYDPAIALLGIYPKDTDAMKRRDTCTPMFIAAMSTIVKSVRSLGVHRKMNG